MTARVITGAEDLKSLIGEELGVSDWLTVDQEMINRFAEVTGDQQWIHVDVERASTGPFGAPIAHGFLTLALIPVLGAQVYEVEGFGARINYGLDKARFPQPLRAGERVRDRVTLSNVEETGAGLRATFTHTLESEAGGKPVCVAASLILFVQG